jgi:DNA-binding SARP family transcriptional activator
VAGSEHESARREFRILGPLEVVRDGKTLALGGLRPRTVLALLLTNANEIVSSDRLIEAVWGACPPRAATNALQYHVSQLRKLLGAPEIIVTREPGYLIRVAPSEFDLLRFERLVEEAEEAQPERAMSLLRDALDLWRGPPLADLADLSFAEPEIRRLEELRLAALERRFEADLAVGHHGRVVAELESLVRDHPFRERFRAALMRALYGDGRQAEALALYRETRQTFVDELGIEPGPELQELERAILSQDPALDPGTIVIRPQRAILVVANEDRLDELLAIAEPLARKPVRELILARLVCDDSELTIATAALVERRTALLDRGVSCRVAAYTTLEPALEVALLAQEQDVDLILVDSSPAYAESGQFHERVRDVLERAPCDVGVLVGAPPSEAGPIVTPFAGAEHDWSAIEVAAWLAASLGTTLRLLGTAAEPALHRRDASRLLARASLLVQQVVGIPAEPLLVPAGEHGIVEAAREASLVVLGLSDRWRSEGIGPARLAVASGSDVPILFVRRGLRPGGIAPPGTLTRFTWTLESQQAEPRPKVP